MRSARRCRKCSGQALFGADLTGDADRLGIVIDEVTRGAPTGVLIPEVLSDVRLRSNSETAIVLVRVHAIPSASSPRIFSRPNRIRPFTVPSGTFSIAAISD